MGLIDRRVLGTKVGAMDGIPLGIYDDLYIRFLEGSNDGIIDSNLEGLLLGV